MIVGVAFAFACAAPPVPAPAPLSPGVIPAQQVVGEAPRVQIPVTLWFDDYDLVLVGRALRRGGLEPAQVEVMGAGGEPRCVGRSEARSVPPRYLDGERCDGLLSEAVLHCSDGRTLELEVHNDEACASGYAKGQDAQGHRVRGVFGGGAARIASVVSEASAEASRRPSLPAVGDEKVDPADLITTGTAFFVSWDGLLVTNHHVIDGAGRIQVQIDGDLVDAEVVSAEAEDDFALLRVEALREPLPVLDKHGLGKGDEVFSLGYPLVNLQGQEQKASFGRVNALSGPLGDVRFVQVDVPTQPGNSGGPLLNARGEVVGIMTSVLNPTVALELAGIVPQNVNYALKSDIAYRDLRRRFGDEWTAWSADEEAGEEPEVLEALIRRLESSVVLVVAE